MPRQLTLSLALRRSRHALRRALVGGERSLAEAALRSTVIAPAEVAPRRLPRMPEGHLDRILGGISGESSAEARCFLARDTFHHDATVAHYFDRGTLVGDRLLLDAAVLRLHACLPLSLLERAPRLEHGVLAGCYTATRWFGHFLHDEVPLRLLAATIGAPFGHRRERYVHESAYEAAFGLPHLPTFGVLRVAGCAVLDDHAQNQDKRRRYLEMRAALQIHSVAGRRVYLRLTQGAERTLTNEAALIERLTREGFAIVDTGVRELGPILEQLRGAEAVLGVDGSHFAPALLCAADGASVTSILPPSGCTATLTDIGTVLGHDMGVFVARPAAGSGNRFAVDVDELLAFLDGRRLGSSVSLALSAALSLTAPTGERDGRSRVGGRPPSGRS